MPWPLMEPQVPSVGKGDHCRAVSQKSEKNHSVRNQLGEAACKPVAEASGRSYEPFKDEQVTPYLLPYPPD